MTTLTVGGRAAMRDCDPFHHQLSHVPVPPRFHAGITPVSVRLTSLMTALWAL